MSSQRNIEEIQPLLGDIKQIVENIYQNDLVEVVLFGSFAHSSASVESDIDIAVILERTVNKSREIDILCDALYDLMLESGELISVTPISRDEFHHSEWPLYHHIKTEGIKL